MKIKKRYLALSVAAVSSMAILAGCKGGGGDDEPTAPVPDVEKTPEASLFQPAPMATWDIQYTGTMRDLPVEVQFLDMFDTSASRIGEIQAQGTKVVCYISAGSYEDWRPDIDRFQPEDLGKDMSWPGETWLDIRRDNVRAIMSDRVALAASKGCDAIDFDNIDGYVNDTGLTLTKADQIDYAKYLSAITHEQGMAVGQKNVPQLVPDLEPYFEFALSESCMTYNECDYFSPFIDNNKAVFLIQYEDKYKTDPAERESLCQESANRMISTLMLDWDLGDTYRDSCL